MWNWQYMAAKSGQGKRYLMFMHLYHCVLAAACAFLFTTKSD